MQRSLAKQSQFVPHRSEKMPSSRAGNAAVARDNRAKRTQFATRRVGTGETDHAKQSQLPPGRCRARARPELAEGTLYRFAGAQGRLYEEPNCAERTQFPAVPGATRPRDVGRGAIVRNEPNFQWCQVGRGHRDEGRAANCAKQSQTCAGWGIWGVGAPGRSQWCETKPIRSRQANAGLGGGAARIALLPPGAIITPSSCGAGHCGGNVGWRPQWI
jgi:hypothetical protein